MTTDPVCSSEIDEMVAARKRLIAEYGGRTFMFCCDECKQRFDHDPAAYATTLPAWDDPDLTFRSWPVE